MNEENRTNIPRLRTIPKALEEVQFADPNTALTMRALRRMVNTGEIPTVAINSKRLIDMNLLYNHLSCNNKPVFCVS